MDVWNTAEEPPKILNGFHAVWDSEPVCHVVYNKHLAFLSFYLEVRLFVILKYLFFQDHIVSDIQEVTCLGQNTVRLSNVRSGLRRVTFRNKRDSREFPMATILVDIQVQTLEDLINKIERLNEQVFWQIMLYKIFTE